MLVLLEQLVLLRVLQRPRGCKIRSFLHEKVLTEGYRSVSIYDRGLQVVLMCWECYVNER